MDMQGLHDSYAGHDDLMRARTDLENKKISEGKEIEKLSAGKTTLKSLFKSKTQKDAKIASFSEKAEAIDQEIASYEKLINFLHIYHADECIPNFKKAKAKLYV